MTALVITELRHSAGFLVSEDEPGRLSRDQVTVLQQTYSSDPLLSQAGTILGKTLDGTSGTYAANSGNTGNFTCGTVTVGQGVIEGAYRGEFRSATVYDVFDPNNTLVGEGKTGAAFSGEGLGFTLTAGGTAAVVGDGFSITLAANSNVGLYAPLSLTAADGTQIPAAILLNTMDISIGNTKCAVISNSAEVNGGELIYPSGASASQIATVNAQLATLCIKVR